MKYKMIVADFDDTILKDDLTYSKEFVQAVKDYERAGGKFVIATGRMTGSVRAHCQKMGLKGEVVSYQGGVISDIESGDILFSSPMEIDVGIEIARYMEDMGVYFHLYENDTIVVNNVSEYSVIYAKFTGCELKKVDTPLSEYIAGNNIPPIKMLIMAEPKLINGYIKELNKVFSDRLLINTSKKWIVEIVSKDINKGVAVAKLAKKYQIKREEVICIGDSLNDLSMLEYAGLSVVVANGSQEALEIADIIAPSNNDDGVAYIIRKFGLGENI